MKKKSRNATSGQEKARRRKPKKCFCGGAPMTHMMPRVMNDPTVYHIVCGACRWTLCYQKTIVDFPSEAAAIAAWNLTVSGKLAVG